MSFQQKVDAGKLQTQSSIDIAPSVVSVTGGGVQEVAPTAWLVAARNRYPWNGYGSGPFHGCA